MALNMLGSETSFIRTLDTYASATWTVEWSLQLAAMPYWELGHLPT